MVNQNKCLLELAPSPTNTEIELQKNEYKKEEKMLLICTEVFDYDKIK